MDCAWLDKVVFTSQSASVISVNPASLSNSCQQGQNAASQSFEVWNSGGGTLTYSISDNAAWLSVTPASGSSITEHDTILVNYSTAGLTAGTYHAVITVSAANLTSQTVNVTLIVSPAAPTIGLNPTTLNPHCAKGKNAASQSFEIWNSGGGTLTYSISDNAAWLSVTPASGTSTGEHDTITGNYSTAALPNGTYNATITVTASGASNSPRTIPVKLTVAGSQPWLLLLLD